METERNDLVGLFVRAPWWVGVLQRLFPAKSIEIGDDHEKESRSMTTRTYVEFTGVDRLRLVLSGRLVVVVKQEFPGTPPRIVSDNSVTYVQAPFFKFPEQVERSLKENG